MKRFANWSGRVTNILLRSTLSALLRKWPRYVRTKRFRSILRKIGLEPEKVFAVSG